MIICPLEGVVVFGECLVLTCMWNDKRGKCQSFVRGNDTFNKDTSDRTPEELASVKKIQDFVSVGLFLEDHSGKELHALKARDIPSKDKFVVWAKRKGANKAASTQTPYDSIVDQIKAAL